VTADSLPVRDLQARPRRFYVRDEVRRAPGRLATARLLGVFGEPGKSQLIRSNPPAAHDWRRADAITRSMRGDGVSPQ